VWIVDGLNKIFKAPEGLSEYLNALCDLCELCASGVNLFKKMPTTETQKTLRRHRERKDIHFPASLQRSGTSLPRIMVQNPFAPLELIRFSDIRCL